MIALTTPVEMPSHLPRLSQELPMMLLGSCFASEIGKRLQQAKFDCDLNPYGVLYNPLSIAAALQEIVSGRTYTEADLLQHNGLWHSMMHHGDFSATSPEVVLESINRRIRMAHERLPRLERLVLTLGTAYVYRHVADGQVVGNCHQLPERCFHRERVTVDEVVEVLSSLLQRLKVVSPSLQVMLTVSPIRHLRDGLHANQLSKGTLLLAADALTHRHEEFVHYFPSYELVMDELRDYRFYADDLTHPSPLAVEYIWKRLVQSCFTPKALQVMEECDKVRKALQHRALHPEGEAYKCFLEQTMLKIERLKGKYPYLDLQNEHEACLTLLNTLPNR